MRILALNPLPADAARIDEHIERFPERRAGTLFPLGLALAAEVLARIHEVECRDERIDGPLAPPFRHDLIALPVTVASFPRLREIRRATRDAGVRLLAGGPLATTAPDLVSPHADLLVRGEIEPLAEALLAALDRPGDAGTPVALGPGARTDPPRAPDPRRFPPGAELIPYELARGCTHGCAFCDTPGLFPGGRRVKPPAQVAEEIARITAHAAESDAPPPTLFLTDDDAAADPDLLAAALGALAGAGMRIVAKARAASLARLPDDLDLAPILFLNIVCRDRPADPLPGDAERDLIGRLAARRLRVEATVVAGHPGDDAAVLARIESFLAGLPVTKICLHPVLPLPGRAGHDRHLAALLAGDRDAALEAALEPSAIPPAEWRRFVAAVRAGMARDGLAALKRALRGDGAAPAPNVAV